MQCQPRTKSDEIFLLILAVLVPPLAVLLYALPVLTFGLILGLLLTQRAVESKAAALMS